MKLGRLWKKGYISLYTLVLYILYMIEPYIKGYTFLLTTEL